MCLGLYQEYGTTVVIVTVINTPIIILLFLLVLFILNGIMNHTATSSLFLKHYHLENSGASSITVAL
jgi:hypothetical protein